MGVTLQPPPLVAHDQKGFGVGLESAHAVDDVGPGAAQFLGAVQISRLVEAGLQFDEHGHMFAVLGRADERVDDAAVRGGAVEDLFDRHHVRVVGRFLDEPHHRIKTLVGMDEQEILLGDGIEDGNRRIDLRDRLRRPRLDLQALEIGQARDLEKRLQIEQPRKPVGRLMIGAPEFLQHRHEGPRRALLDFEPHRSAGAARGEDFLHFIGQVGGFLVPHHHVAVAGDAEGRGRADFLAGKKFLQMRGHHILEGQELVTGGVGHTEETRQALGQRENGEARFATLGVAQLGGERQLEIRNERGGFAVAFDRHRGENRINVLLEITAHVILLHGR